MQTILKGDTSQALTFALAEGFDYTGKTLHVKYQGAVKTFTGATAGGTVQVVFTAAETASMSLGAFPVEVWLTDGAGSRLTIQNQSVKIKVTDDPNEVYTGGAIAISARGILFGIDDLPERYTDADIVAKIREILTAGGALLCALLCLNLHGAQVQTARKDAVYNDQQIVTNVTFGGLATTTELEGLSNAVFGAVSGKVSPGQLADATNAVVEEVTEKINGMTVDRVPTVGTDSHWMDATGCVWEVTTAEDWEITYPEQSYYEIHLEASGLGDGQYWVPYVGTAVSGIAKGNADSTYLVWESEAIIDFSATKTVKWYTNLVGRVTTVEEVNAAITEAGYMTRDDCVDLVNETKALFPASNTNLVYKLRVEWTGEGGAFYFDAYTNATEAAEAR